MSEPRSMGMFDFSDIILVREFRWAISIDGLPATTEQLFKCVSFAYHQKIDIIAYEMVRKVDGKWVDSPLIEWLKNLKNGSLTFTTYDGCGFEIYKTTYTGLTLASLESTFDYSSSEASTLHFTLAYENAERRFVYDPGAEAIGSQDRAYSAVPPVTEPPEVIRRMSFPRKRTEQSTVSAKGNR